MPEIEEEIGISPSSSASPTALANPDGSKDADPNPQRSNSPPAATPPNLRSCTTCRKRKVRCDKKNPCASCLKTGSVCIFPGPGRAPRRSRKPQDAELMARLKRLEGVVQSLNNVPPSEGEVEPWGLTVQENPNKIPDTLENLENGGCLGRKIMNMDSPPPGLVKEFGRLSVEGGRSAYVSNRFWVSLSEEYFWDWYRVRFNMFIGPDEACERSNIDMYQVAEMRDLLDDRTDDDEDYPSPISGSAASVNHQGFIFGFSSMSNSLREFHPPADQICAYWQIFKENIDPLIKIFHRPTTELLFLEAAQDLDHISKPMEVLMFTIYFAVITSMSESECINILGGDKQAMLENYRFAFEQAIARADFLSTQELVILQSFTLFLTCVRRLDDSRYVWTLTGLAIRLAQSLGIHRDGERFGLSPFETEMRRRLWWQICAIDVRASEDHGSDFFIVEQSFDTKLPLNINDEDISPDMTETPVEREGKTEMMFDLIRYSVSTTVRQLSYAPPGRGPCRKINASITLQDKERLIDELNQYLDQKYLNYCKVKEDALDWVAATVSRLIVGKMWLIVHHPFRRDDGGAGLPQETKDRLFATSMEVIQFSHLLETEHTTQKWGWLFRTYVPWHAIAFVLSQLCIRTSGLEVETAWSVIENVFEDWSGTGVKSKRGMLWKPLRKLMAKARLVRGAELERRSKVSGLSEHNDETMLMMDGNEILRQTSNMANPAHHYENAYSYLPTAGVSNSHRFASQQQGHPPDLPLGSSMAISSPVVSMDPLPNVSTPPLNLSNGWNNNVEVSAAFGNIWWNDWLKDFVQVEQGVERETGEGMINWF